MAATEMEIQPFINSKPGVDILISGVGSPSTIYQLLKKITSTSYDLVLQAGIGGRFSHSSIKLTECTLISSDVFADLGVQENNQFYSLADMKFTGATEHPYKDGLLVNNHNFLFKSALPKVSGMTVNRVSDDNFQTEVFSAKYKAEVESMEGAALHYVCLLESVPFLQLRCISNDVGVREKSSWRMGDAIINLNRQLARIVEDFKNV